MASRADNTPPRDNYESAAATLALPAFSSAVISESATVKTGDSGTLLGSFPVISSPCLGHEYLPEVCRILPASLRLMTTSRSHLSGPTLCRSRIFILLLPTQYVERCFS